jgi:hypothetical protein
LSIKNLLENLSDINNGLAFSASAYNFFFGVIICFKLGAHGAAG